MKKNLLLFIFFIFIICSVFSQDKTIGSPIVDIELNIDSFYQKKDELLIFTGIHVFDSISKSELVKKVKNWGSTKFVNLKEVLVSETEDQLVFNYITNSYFITTKVLRKNYQQTVGWYIRLVVQFKDGRIRCIFYDDGNAAILPNQYSPGLSSRTYKFKEIFKEKNGVFVIDDNARINGLISLRKSVEDDFISIKMDIMKLLTKSEEW